MSIDFCEKRWQRVQETYDAFWAGELDRPVMQFMFRTRDPERPAPELPMHNFTAFYGLDTPAEAIVDVWDYHLSRYEFLGDYFPHQLLNLGPGVLAAYIGGELVASPDAKTCWFHPKEEKEIPDITFELDENSPWYQKTIEIYNAAVERWQGAVQLDFTDLGGSMDVLSSFRPSEKLLMDLYDYPEQVKALCGRLNDLWFDAFAKLNAIIKPTNPGYTAWAPLFSGEPYYMLQCDFAYMIGPDMFDEFVKPDIEKSCERLANPFYHLDGPGQLPHLDSLLSIEKLKGIQWVPGSGAPGNAEWPEVYAKIRDAGKLMQLMGTVDDFDKIISDLGTTKGVLFTSWERDRDKALDCLARYGVSPD